MTKKMNKLQLAILRDVFATIASWILNRSFATGDHVVENPPCWRANSLLFPHWDWDFAKSTAFAWWPFLAIFKMLSFLIVTWSSEAWLAFVLMSQCGNNNELACPPAWRILYHVIVSCKRPILHLSSKDAILETTWPKYVTERMDWSKRRSIWLLEE